VIAADVVDAHNALCHDTAKRAGVLLRLLEQAPQAARQRRVSATTPEVPTEVTAVIDAALPEAREA